MTLEKYTAISFIFFKKKYCCNILLKYDPCFVRFVCKSTLAESPNKHTQKTSKERRTALDHHSVPAGVKLASTCVGSQIIVACVEMIFLFTPFFSWNSSERWATVTGTATSSCFNFLSFLQS